MELTAEEYAKDPRIACKYGSKCYQQNPGHHLKYKHPPKKNRPRKPKIFPNNYVSSENILSSDSENEGEKAASSSSGEEEGQEAMENNEKLSESQTNKEEQNENSNTETSSVCQPNKKRKLHNNDVQFENHQTKDFYKEFIKSKFLVEMPNDFYAFWDFCKTLNPTKPQLAFSSANLTLVGPYDVLAGKFDDKEFDDEKYLIHWRFYYDPPEFQTVLVGSSGHHIGYFRDTPLKNPAFLAENYGEKDGVFTRMGENIFAAVFIYLQNFVKTAGVFKQVPIKKLIGLVKKEAEKLKLTLSKDTPAISKRIGKICASSFSKLGIVVPYDKKTQVGYRSLAMSNRDLKTLLEKLAEAEGDHKARLMSQLQPVLTYASIAADECDFGTGLELGLDLLYSGIEHLNVLTKNYLTVAYNLLGRSEFALIAKAHMDNRRKGSNLSIV